MGRVGAAEAAEGVAAMNMNMPQKGDRLVWPDGTTGTVYDVSDERLSVLIDDGPAVLRDVPQLDREGARVVPKAGDPIRVRVVQDVGDFAVDVRPVAWARANAAALDALCATMFERHGGRAVLSRPTRDGYLRHSRMLDVETIAADFAGELRARFPGERFEVVGESLNAR